VSGTLQTTTDLLNKAWETPAQTFINAALMNDQHLIVRDTETALLITVIMVR